MIKIALTNDELQELIATMRFTKQRVRDAQGPYEVRRKTLALLDSIEEKLRAAKVAA